MKTFYFILLAIGIVLLTLTLSCAATIGIVKLITLCFGLDFNLSYALGIWLIMILLSSIFSGMKGKK